jgi:hypothetical protein
LGGGGREERRNWLGLGQCPEKDLCWPSSQAGICQIRVTFQENAALGKLNESRIKYNYIT